MRHDEPRTAERKLYCQTGLFGFHEERSIDIRKELIRHFFKVISEVGGVFRMVGNVILLDKLFKNREIKIAGKPPEDSLADAYSSSESTFFSSV